MMKNYSDKIIDNVVASFLMDSIFVPEHIIQNAKKELEMQKYILIKKKGECDDVRRRKH